MIFFVQVFDKKEARRQQIFPGLAEDSKPADFDIFLKEISSWWKLVGLPSKIKGVPVYQEIGRFTMKNGGFTMKHDGFPIRNGRFTMERGEFTMKSQNKWHFISYDGNMMGRLTWVNWWFSTGDWFDDFIGKIWDSPSDPNWLQLGEVILRVACFPHFSSPCDP